MAAMAIAGGTFLLAYAVALRVCPPRQRLLRWTGTMAAQVWTLAVLFHALALTHLFALLPALVAVGVLAAAAWVLPRPWRLRTTWTRDAVYARRIVRLVITSPHRWIIAAFCLAAAPGLLHALVVPPLAWDTLTYHGVKPAMWVQTHGVDAMVGTGPWAYYENMPGGAELFWAWAMLP